MLPEDLLVVDWIRFVIDRIDYVTIASTGNAIDFGDLTASKKMCWWCLVQPVVFLGGYTVDASNRLNAIEYVQFATQGNAVDFGFKHCKNGAHIIVLMHTEVYNGNITHR